MKTKRKRGRGRPPLPEEKKVTLTSVYLTQADAAPTCQNATDRWTREQRQAEAGV